jgi:hypothetical protein
MWLGPTYVPPSATYACPAATAGVPPLGIPPMQGAVSRGCAHHATCIHQTSSSVCPGAYPCMPLAWHMQLGYYHDPIDDGSRIFRNGTYNSIVLGRLLHPCDLTNQATTRHRFLPHKHSLAIKRWITLHAHVYQWKYTCTMHKENPRIRPGNIFTKSRTTFLIYT